MKHRAICITILLSLAFVFSSYTQQGDIPVLQGPSLGQKSPGLKPEIFAPGIVATVSHEFSCCFSPDGKEFYFTQRHPELNETFLMVSKLVEGVWTKVDVAPFVEKQFSFEPWVTPDNKRLYFQSGRVSEGVLQMFTLYVERNGEGKFAV